VAPDLKVRGSEDIVSLILMTEPEDDFAALFEASLKQKPFEGPDDRRHDCRPRR
jgi:hypothetical protein